MSVGYRSHLVVQVVGLSACCLTNFLHIPPTAYGSVSRKPPSQSESVTCFIAHLDEPESEMRSDTHSSSF